MERALYSAAPVRGEEHSRPEAPPRRKRVAPRPPTDENRRLPSLASNQTLSTSVQSPPTEIIVSGIEPIRSQRDSEILPHCVNGTGSVMAPSYQRYILENGTEELGELPSLATRDPGVLREVQHSRGDPARKETSGTGIDNSKSSTSWGNHDAEETFQKIRPPQQAVKPNTTYNTDTLHLFRPPQIPAGEEREHGTGRRLSTSLHDDWPSSGLPSEVSVSSRRSSGSCEAYLAKLAGSGERYSGTPDDSISYRHGEGNVMRTPTVGQTAPASSAGITPRSKASASSIARKRRAPPPPPMTASQRAPNQAINPVRDAKSQQALQPRSPVLHPAVDSTDQIPTQSGPLDILPPPPGWETPAAEGWSRPVSLNTLAAQPKAPPRHHRRPPPMASPRLVCDEDDDLDIDTGMFEMAEKSCRKRRAPPPPQMARTETTTSGVETSRDSLQVVNDVTQHSPITEAGDSDKENEGTEQLEARYLEPTTPEVKTDEINMDEAVRRPSLPPALPTSSPPPKAPNSLSFGAALRSVTLSPDQGEDSDVLDYFAFLDETRSSYTEETGSTSSALELQRENWATSEVRPLEVPKPLPRSTYPLDGPVLPTVSDSGRNLIDVKSEKPFSSIEESGFPSVVVDSTSRQISATTPGSEFVEKPVMTDTTQEVHSPSDRVSRFSPAEFHTHSVPSRDPEPIARAPLTHSKGLSLQLMQSVAAYRAMADSESPEAVVDASINDSDTKLCLETDLESVITESVSGDDSGTGGRASDVYDESEDNTYGREASGSSEELAAYIDQQNLSTREIAYAANPVHCVRVDAGNYSNRDDKARSLNKQITYEETENGNHHSAALVNEALKHEPNKTLPSLVSPKIGHASHTEQIPPLIFGEFSSPTKKQDEEENTQKEDRKASRDYRHEGSFVRSSKNNCPMHDNATRKEKGASRQKRQQWTPPKVQLGSWTGYHSSIQLMEDSDYILHASQQQRSPSVNKAWTPSPTFQRRLRTGKDQENVLYEIDIAEGHQAPFPPKSFEENPIAKDSSSVSSELSLVRNMDDASVRDQEGREKREEQDVNTPFETSIPNMVVPDMNSVTSDDSSSMRSSGSYPKLQDTSAEHKLSYILPSRYESSSCNYARLREEDVRGIRWDGGSSEHLQSDDFWTREQVNNTIVEARRQSPPTANDGSQRRNRSMNGGSSGTTDSTSCQQSSKWRNSKELRESLQETDSRSVTSTERLLHSGGSNSHVSTSEGCSSAQTRQLHWRPLPPRQAWTAAKFQPVVKGFRSVAPPTNFKSPPEDVSNV